MVKPIFSDLTCIFASSVAFFWEFHFRPPRQTKCYSEGRWKQVLRWSHRTALNRSHYPNCTKYCSSRVCHQPSSFPLVSCEPVGLLCNGATRCCTLQKDELGFLGQYELRHYIISQRAHDSLGGKRKGDDRRGHCCVNLVCPPSVMQVMWLSATVNSRIGISGREGTTADSERNGENWESSRPSHQLLFSLAFFAKGRTAQVRFRGREIISCILAYIEASLSALLPSFPCIRWRFMTDK